VSLNLHKIFATKYEMESQVLTIPVTFAFPCRSLQDSKNLSRCTSEVYF